MAKADKKKISKIKVKKKLWYKIIAPKLFGQKELGESYLTSPETALGRSLKINLKDLTGNVKDQKVYIAFKINKIDGSVLRTTACGYETAATYIKKLVRKNTDRLDDHFILKNKSGQEIIIKSLIITFHKTQRSKRSQIKLQLKSLLEEELKESDFSTFIINLINRKVQMTIKKKLHKIFPIKEVCVRVLKLKDGKETVEVVTKVEEPETKAEVKEEAKEKVEEPKEEKVEDSKKEEVKEEETSEEKEE